MKLNVNQIILSKDISAKNLVNRLLEIESELCLNSANLYHNFPLYKNEETDSNDLANILIISESYGILLFSCISERNSTLSEEDIQKIILDLEQIYSTIYSKLLKFKSLRKSPQELTLEIQPFIYNTKKLTNQEKFIKHWKDLIISNPDEILQQLKPTMLQNKLSGDITNEIVATIEGSRVITKTTERDIKNSDNQLKGNLLSKIESRIALFDQEQKKAALITLDKPQRIRGLAGSGKTVILARKAAQIHLQDPDANILYTFWTRSLYPQIKELITKYYRQFSYRDPDWDKIHILHAWGGKNLPGVYFNACLNNEIAPLTFRDVKSIKNNFEKICDILLKKNLKIAYDYSILDEAQDFPPNFYRLCREITKDDKIIWAYDECQNIFNITIQDTKKTFGKSARKQTDIDFSQLPPESPQDLILHICYRNPRKILVVAFALGFGLYNGTIVQMLENNEHWEDLGFKVIKGKSKTGDKMEILRPEENSPLLKNTLLDTDEVVRIKVFKKFEKEIDFIVNGISNDIKEKLRPEDIMVISLDDRNARGYFSEIEEELSKKGINSFNLLSAPSINNDFYLEGCVTLTTVYRAKGNEAGSVYIVGIDSVFNNKNFIRERNKVFTSLTRANGWVTISGLGETAEECKNEVDQALKNYPFLKFTMPNRRSMKTHQRDLAENQAELNKIIRELEKVEQKSGLSKQEILKKILTKEKLKK